MMKMRRDVTLVTITPSLALRDQLFRTVNKVNALWADQLREQLLAAVDSQLTTDNDIIKAAFQAAIGALDTYLTGDMPKEVSNWTSDIESWHRRRFATTVRNATGVDVYHYLDSIDVLDEMTAIVERNVGLIKGLSADVGRQVQLQVWNAVTQQTPRRDLAKQLQKVLGVGRDRALLIAMDQTNKVSADLDRLRQTQAGIDEYIWRHSRKKHPRVTHVARDGKVFKWSKPPEDGHPGQAIRCGCKAQAYVRK
jgi:SPP1 gp7 family putative phage head morphogenesis protein